MRPALWTIVVALLPTLWGAGACRRGLVRTVRSLDRLGAVRLAAPRGVSDAFVFLFSDARGWNGVLDAAAGALADQGVAVAGIDLPDLLARLAASDDGCHYLVADLEAASRALERELGFAAFRAPVLVGIGEGATLAYAALAQAPAATIGGALGLPHGPPVPTRVPLCPGAGATRAPQGFTYEKAAELPGWLAPALPPDVGAAELADAVASAIAAHAPPARGALARLPLTEIPAPGSGDLFAIIFSGDGGWRDLDKTIGEELARRGVPVVGVDSLRYFWKARTPAGVAADTRRLIEHYGARWDRPYVMLIGYSFGAGVLPFAVSRLPADARRRVVEVTLLGLEPVASFEFHVGGWLGRPDPNGLPVRPELQRLDPALVQCVYGEEETESLCRDASLGPIERIRTAGGHHFDGNYAGLAARILAGARRRLAGVLDNPRTRA